MNLGYVKGKDYELKFGGNDKYFEFLNMRYFFLGLIPSYHSTKY